MVAQITLGRAALCQLGIEHQRSRSSHILHFPQPHTAGDFFVLEDVMNQTQATPQATNQKRILTGDRPTGKLHIGHLFGSLQQRVALQHQYQTFVLLADVQALTDHFHNPALVRENVLEVALDNLAVGLDPNVSRLVIQSQIPQIAELTVFFSNLVTLSRLQQNPTVKTEIAEKRSLFGESVTYGFLGYPVSQAADITIFDADLVPVGEDQLPQLEQTRELVRKFNSIYGKADGAGILKEPQIQLSATPRVRGLDGNSKMGKSLGNAVYLSDSSVTVGEKVLTALTDPLKARKTDPGRPEVCTVFSYHQMFSPNAPEIALECRSGARGCVDCKLQLARSINTQLEPIRQTRAFYQSRPKDVMDLVMEGTREAGAIAEVTLARVKEGLYLNYGFD